MSYLKRVLKAIGKSISLILLLVILAVVVSSVSLIYDFREPKPFCGEDIYNPYSRFDTSIGWKRANFHTHTRVEGIMNECEMWPDRVHAELSQFGYDIITFSNHNSLTTHPFDSTLQVNLYEHGYNLFKYHKLVFGADEVNHFDHLLPLLASQKQFQIDYLREGADFIQINHPLRTHTISKQQMQKLSGYRLIELDSGKSTENDYWDWALSAGHYSHAVANDDLHFPDRSHCIAVRCNFLCCPTAHYDDIKSTLLDGCFYSMRVPDYGHGDWQIKRAKNRTLPHITNIGLQESTIYIALSHRADSIKVTGQDHRRLLLREEADSAAYTMQGDDSYARITAYFPEGEVIYTNAFARYDASVAESPYDDTPQRVNLTLTILYNLLLLLLSVGVITIAYKLLSKR